MKKRLIATALVLTLLGVSCMHNKSNTQDHNLQIISKDIPLPGFFADVTYRYEKNEGDDMNWHVLFIIDSAGYRVTEKKQLFDHLDKIIPSETTRSEIIEKYGIPPKVVIAETNKNNPERFYHLNFIYDELSFYFGVDYDVLHEIRIEDASEFSYKGISYNTSYNDVIETLPPEEIVEGSEIDWKLSGVLFKDINGEKGYHYIDYKDRNVRMFFWDNKVSALYFY